MARTYDDAEKYRGYVYGSAAPALVPEAVPQEPIVPETQPGQAPRPEPWIHLRPIDAVIIVAGILAVLVLAGSSIIQSVSNYNHKNSVYSLQEEYAEAQSRTVIAGEAEAQAISEIREYATGVLGMVNADKDSVFTLTVIPRGYTGDYSDVEPEKKATVFHWFGK